MNNKCKALIFILFLLVTVKMSAQQKSSKTLTDHPLYARRENAQIVSKKVFHTKEYNLIKRYKELSKNGEIIINDFKLMTAEGKLTRITYFVPAWRMYVEQDSLLVKFCSDIIFMHEFVSPFKRDLDVYVPAVKGFYNELGEAKDKVPVDNFYFVLSRFKDGKKVYVIITGSYNLYQDGNYYVVDVIETNEEQFISIYEIADYIHKEVSINIASILFETGSDKLSKESINEVRFLADFMKSEPELEIIIGGHTDNIGNANYNLKLSENRAKRLKNILVETHGIEASRLTTIGYGESNPIANNRTIEGRAQNRRVEIMKKK